MQIDNKVATVVIVLVIAVVAFVVMSGNEGADTSGTLAGETPPPAIALGR